MKACEPLWGKMGGKIITFNFYQSMGSNKISNKVLQNASQGSRTISDHVEVLGRVKEASRGTLEHFGGDRLFGPSDPPKSDNNLPKIP